MIKLIACAVILGASTRAGFIYSERLKYRVFQLNEVQRAIYQLQNEITYVHALLPDAFKSVAQKSKEPIRELFNKTGELLSDNDYENVYEAMNCAMNLIKSRIYLNPDDINVILDLSKTLGESDIEGQISIFSLTLANLKKQIKISEDFMNKNVRMYRYLGFSFGAVIVIALI
ncbi:stage III sporulation protein SpoAB [Clostridium estertheticum]|uniref:stage III sporulation protein SpoIIIAB n=1 Tax=Clostridium estertheticum TaxID=238834 RepID=UPI0013E97840|nr:stage III sporulation protein SpoIIIAB [Clostridium estertheticum]MBZ9688013.1 stage III sporulation protein SpoAB [Clostridium estertheticum]